MDNANESLKAAEAECAAVSKAPRVSLADIEAAIADKFYIDGANLARGSLYSDGVVSSLAADQHIAKLPPLAHLTVCQMVMKNGFVVIGKSAPASPDNFDRNLGRKLAYEDCIRQLWPLMGFALRDRLAGPVRFVDDPNADPLGG
jgi:hypothetical protein